MSPNPKDNEAEPQAPEGEERSEGSLAMNDELEAALREATETVESLHAQRAGQAGAPGEQGAEGGGGSADKMTIELLSRELQALKEHYESTVAEYEELADRHVRLQAEFDNFRRRGLKERQESQLYGHQNLVKDLLSTVDNLERAIEHSEQSDGGDLKGLLQGVELVMRELLAALGKHGVEPIEAEGQPFDPAVHEAMAQVESAEVAPNTVVQVIQKGYQLRDRMLRPARVVVSKGAGAQEVGAEAPKAAEDPSAGDGQD